MKKINLLFLSAFLFFTLTGQAVNCLDQNAPASNRLCNPAIFAANVPHFAINLIRVIGIIIGWTVIAYVMFAGFRMITSQGNEEEISKAKSTLQWALSGLILALFAYVIVYAVGDFIGVGETPVERPTQILNPLESNTFAGVFQTMFRNFLTVSGILAILLIVVSGFRYITARGNEEQVSQAQKGLQWAVIGLIVILLSYVIVVATASFFGATITTNP